MAMVREVAVEANPLQKDCNRKNTYSIERYTRGGITIASVIHVLIQRMPSEMIGLNSDNPPRSRKGMAVNIGE